MVLGPGGHSDAVCHRKVLRHGSKIGILHIIKQQRFFGDRQATALSIGVEFVQELPQRRIKRLRDSRRPAGDFEQGGGPG